MFNRKKVKRLRELVHGFILDNFNLTTDNNLLLKRLKEVRSELSETQLELAKVKQENVKLKTENIRLKDELKELGKRIKEFKTV